MKYDVLQEAVTKKEEHKKKRAWHKVVTCMAAVVVFCTVYALILPAITLESKPTCGKEEHQHTGECYAFLEDAFQLVCGSTEHTHDDILCYIDNSADVEDAAVWEATLPSRLIGEYRHDLLKVAESQLDYQESVRNSIIDKEGYLKGYTRYGAWAEDAYGDWNAYFLAFCLHYAGLEEEAFPWSADYGQWIQMLTQKELFVKVGKHSAEAGDIVFLDMDGDGIADRAALVTELVTGEDGVQRLSVIEGDAGGTECYVGTEEDTGESSVIIPVENTPAPGNTTVSGGDSTAGSSQSVSGGDNVSGGTVSNGDNTTSGSASYVDNIVPTPKPQITAGYVAGGVATVSYESDGENIVGYGILPEQIFYCEKEAHLHGDDCYDENGTLICELAEHVHIETCTNPGPLTEEEQAKVDKVIALIDAMPSVDEIYEKLGELYEAGDEEGEEAYMEEVIQQVCRAYQAYSKLSLWQKTFVTNEEKLLELEFIWSVHTLASSEYDVVDAVSVPGVTVKLFNYDETVNFQKTAYPQADISNTDWYARWVGSNDTKQAGFRFWAYQHSTTVDGTGAASGSMGYEPVLALESHQELVANRLVNGYPYLNPTTGLSFTYKDYDTYNQREYWTTWDNVEFGGGSMDYLFDGTFGGYTMQDGGGLFQKDSAGYYYYNSAYNAASYDTSEGQFKLYDYVVRPDYDEWNDNGDIANGNFLPFTSVNDVRLIDGEYQSNGQQRAEVTSDAIDFWFGMMIEVDFYMPADGKVNGEDMIFEFTGDDDVYVYVDDVLLLNLGGAHSAWNGVINFAKGTASGGGDSYSWNTTFEEAYTEDGDPKLEDGTFISYTKHTMKFFYMDRGANVSHCNIRFNLAQAPENTLEITKALDDSEVDEALQNDVLYPFRIIKTNKDGNAITTTDEAGNTVYVPYFEEGTQYQVISSAPYEDEAGIRTLGEDGIFYLRAGQSAYFENSLLSTDSDEKYVIQELIPESYHGQYKELEYWVRSTNDSETGDTEQGGEEGTTETTETKTLIYNGWMQSGDWESSLQLDASKFSGLSFDGSEKLVITYITTEGAEESQFKLANFDPETVYAEFYNLGAATTETILEIPLTSAYGDIASRGVFIQGKYWDITQVNIVKTTTTTSSGSTSSSTTSSVIDKGTIPIDSTLQTTINGITYWVYSTSAIDPGYNQTFEFKNYVDTAELGKLSITKTLNGTEKVANTNYQMQVKLGGELLEVGTKYTITSSDNTTETCTVTTAGIISLKAGQTAVIEDILSGTTYEVSEIVSGAYHAEYTRQVIQHEDVSDTTCTESPVIGNVESLKAEVPSGTFAVHDHVYVTVINTWYSQTVEIPVTKECVNNEDNKKATFNFTVEEGTWDGTTWTPSTSAIVGKQSITVTGAEVQTEKFTVGYDLENGTASGIFYYKITEVSGKSGYVYDDSEYIIQVSVENTSTATVTKVWKDGVDVTSAYDSNTGVTFVNQRVTSVTVTKDVPDTEVNDKFTFTAEVKDANGNAVTLPASSKYTVNGNKIIFSLGDGGSQTLTGIPIGGTVMITEAENDNYLTSSLIRYDFEAEEGEKNEGSETVVSSDPNASNGAFVEKMHDGETSQPGTLTYQIEAAEDCTAQLYFKYATAESRTFRITVWDSEKVSYTRPNDCVVTGSSWYTWVWQETPIEIKLKKGTNYIEVGNSSVDSTAEDAPPNLDCLYVLVQGNGNTITATPDDNAVVQFTNILIYQLPKTGGTGTTPYILGGLLIMSASIAMLLLLYKSKKAEKGG